MTTIFDFLDNVKMDRTSTKRKLIIDDKDEKEEEDISDEVYICDQSIPHRSIPLEKRTTSNMKNIQVIKKLIN